MILYRYFGRRLLQSFGLTLVAFVLILGLIDLVEQLRRHAGEGIPFGRIAGLTALNVPGSLYALLPLVTVLATLAMFLSLSRSSEMVIARAAGRSAMRTLLVPMICVLLLGMGAVALLNPIAAATTARYHALSNDLTGDVGTLSVAGEGLWLRQGNDDGQMVIRALRASADGTELGEVTFMGFDGAGEPAMRIEAERAVLRDGAWQLATPKLWRLDTPNPEALAESRDRMILPTDLTAERIRDSFAAPDLVPVWELPAFIERLERAGFSSQPHRMRLWTEVAMPVFMVAMAMIAASFTMQHTRVSRTGLMVLSALLTGFGLYFVRNFAQVLGESGQLPVLLAAWAPPLAGLFLSVGLILHLEDG